VNLDQLANALGPDVLLVSVMAANNEIGVVAPLKAIAALCKAQGVLLHCDAAQAAGHIPLSMADLEVDLLSISGHKLYGPKGIGALLMRPGVPLVPQLHGGNQQDGLRAGTLPVPLVVGLGAAVEHAMADREARALRLGALRDQLWEGLADLGGLERNGDAQACLPHNLNITVAGVDGNQLHQRLRRQLAVSSGSACSQGSPSPVLAALGRTRQQAAASIRFGLGRATSAAEIALAIATVRDAIKELRASGALRLATRHLALRLRGLASASASDATRGFRVTRCRRPSEAKAVLTRRSSREWKLMTPNNPPATSQSGARCSSWSSTPSSLLTAMRRAWKLRVAGWMRPRRALGG
jgi:cysteine desulfurase